MWSGVFAACRSNRSASVASRSGSCGVVEVVEQPAALLRAQDLQPVQRHRGIGGDLLQQSRQARGQALGRGAIEQVGAVLQLAGEPWSAVSREGEREIELGGASADRSERRRDHSRQIQLRLLVVLQHQHGLEQRLPAEGARRIEHLHQALEGQVLMGVGLQASGAGALEQFDERGIAAGVGAQHQRVDEEADQRIERGLGSSGDGRADGDVGAAAELAEQGSQRGLQQHEQRDALRAAEIRAASGGIDNADSAAGIARCERPRPVGGQRQFGRKIGELLASSRRSGGRAGWRRRASLPSRARCQSV